MIVPNKAFKRDSQRLVVFVHSLGFVIMAQLFRLSGCVVPPLTRRYVLYPILRFNSLFP